MEVKSGEGTVVVAFLLKLIREKGGTCSGYFPFFVLI